MAPCSRTSRSKILVAVCLCLRGASRSDTSHSSITGSKGSNRDARFGYSERGVGHAESNAARTVRHPTRWVR